MHTKLIPALLIGAALWLGISVSNIEGQTEGFVILAVEKAGTGEGAVVSSPPGIHCDDTGDQCMAIFPENTPVTLSIHPSRSQFSGWSNASGAMVQCAATSDCNFILSENSFGRAHFIPTDATSMTTDSSVNCCVRHVDFQGDCQVTVSQNESCGTVLDYLNTPGSVGKTYCGNTQIRGGWEAISCR